MTLLEPIEVEPPEVGPPAATAKPAWTEVTHRSGLILKSSLSLAGLPPYDPDPEWTKALAWSRHTGDNSRGNEGTVPHEDELKLGVIRAKRVARIVMDNHAKYNSLVKKVIKADPKFTLKIRDEAPVVRFDPGLIVDLPGFMIQRDGVDIASGRLCLTVCLHESRSKIWARTSSVRDVAWGQDPCQQLQSLLGQSRAWFEAYARSVKDLYASHISEALLSTGEKRDVDVELAVQNRIEFISGDTELTGLGRLSAAVANGEDVCRDGRAKEAADQLDLLVRCAPDMGLQRDGASPILRSTPTTLDGSRYFFVPHRTARGFRGAYIARAQKDEILFAGIASTDPEPYVTVEWIGEPRREVRGSPSQHVTAELANTVAKYF